MTIQLSFEEKIELIHTRLDTLVDEINFGCGMDFVHNLIDEVDELWDSVKGIDSEIADATISLPYPWQFVHDEETEHHSSCFNNIFLHLLRSPVLKGSITGIIFVGGKAVQTVVEGNSGEILLTEIGDPPIKAQSVEVDHDNGIINVIWNSSHGYPAWFRGSYEYHIPLESVEEDDD